MFALIDRHNRAPSDSHRIDSLLRAGEWFEIGQPQFDEMLDVLPPLFMRADMIAMSSFDGGNVAAVFVTLPIGGVQRWFLGFCDLAIANSPETLRDTIVTRETGPSPDRLSREEKLEAIWNATSWEWKGYADGSQGWGPGHIGRRTIVDGRGNQTPTVLSLLDDLSDEQICRMLPDDTTYLADLGGSGSGTAHSGAASRNHDVPPTADGNP